MKCERCWIETSGMHDYCKHCSKNLCDECMAEGNCYVDMVYRGKHEAWMGDEEGDENEQTN